MTDWQPIDTAPHDREVLLWRSGWDKAPLALWDLIDGEHDWWGWVFKDDSYGPEGDGILWTNPPEDYVTWQPTHWCEPPS